MKYTIRELSLMGITDVQKYIQGFNEKLAFEARVEGSDSFYSFKKEISGNYQNAYEFERELAFDKWVDIHKKVYGFRPKYDTSSWTLQDFEDDMIALSSETDFVYNRFINSWGSSQKNLGFGFQKMTLKFDL